MPDRVAVGEAEAGTDRVAEAVGLIVGDGDGDFDFDGLGEGEGLFVFVGVDVGVDTSLSLMVTAASGPVENA